MSAHTHTRTLPQGLTVQLDVFCGEQAASASLPTHAPTHSNSHSHVCIKPHIHTSNARQSHSQIGRHGCISDAYFLGVFVWNRWKLIVLPSWSREICQIKRATSRNHQRAAVTRSADVADLTVWATDRHPCQDVKIKYLYSFILLS